MSLASPDGELEVATSYFSPSLDLFSNATVPSETLEDQALDQFPVEDEERLVLVPPVISWSQKPRFVWSCPASSPRGKELWEELKFLSRSRQNVIHKTRTFS